MKGEFVHTFKFNACKMIKHTPCIGLVREINRSCGYLSWGRGCSAHTVLLATNPIKKVEPFEFCLFTDSTMIVPTPLSTQGALCCWRGEFLFSSSAPRWMIWFLPRAWNFTYLQTILQHLWLVSSVRWQLQHLVFSPQNSVFDIQHLYITVGSKGKWLGDGSHTCKIIFTLETYLLYATSWVGSRVASPLLLFFLFFFWLVGPHDNTINRDNQRWASWSSQVGSRFGGSQEQKAWTDSSLRRSGHHQTSRSNLPLNDSWAKSGRLATGLQKDGKAKLGFDGVAQTPPRWNDVKDRNNKGSDEAYKHWVLEIKAKA